MSDLTQVKLSIQRLKQEEEELLRQQQQLRERQQKQLQLAQQKQQQQQSQLTLQRQQPQHQLHTQPKPTPSHPPTADVPRPKDGGNEIRILEDSSIRRMVADQAITDLAGVVKELVDNALDAGSKSINIRLYGSGLDIVEVSDEGCGVPSASRPFLATRHTTSKISNVDDIYQGIGMTMGFRGEALFSLAHCSQNLVVATRTASEPVAQKLEFRHDGSLDYSSITTIARKVGTTVAVIRPFDAQPARRADLERRIKTEKMKMYRLLESYAILCVGVAINLYEMGGQRNDPILATSPRSKSLSDTVSSIIGPKFLATLSPIQVDLKDIISPSRSSSEDKSPPQFRRVSTMSDDVGQKSLVEWKASGLISSVVATTMQVTRTMNYYSINGRPVDLPNVTTVLRKVWQTFGGRKRPSCVLQFTLPNDRFDINISPDKREVLLTNEQEICNAIQEAVTALWSSQTNGKFEAQKLEQKLSIPVGTTAQDDHIASPGGHRRHKRRFAFVNDLSMARMQHEPDESNDSEPKPQQKAQSPAAASVPDPETPNPYSSMAAGKGKVVSREELNDMGDNTETPDQSSRKRQRTDEGNPSADGNELSTVRRRLDTELEPKETITNPYAKPRPAPVTPDDHQHQLKPKKEISKSPLSRVSEFDFDANSPDVLKPSARSKQTSLDQFAFRPLNSKVGDLQRQEREKRLKNRADAKKSASKSGADKNRKPAAATRPTTTRTTTEASMDNSDNENQPSDDDDDGDVDNSPVVWSGFSSTEAVVHSARTERLDMQRRKADIRAARRRPSSQSSSDESENAEAAQSVGETDGNGVISLSKKIFRNDMQVIGQFNLGFIIARSSDNHIWILDQHACDEKHKFEQLCRGTVIHEQKLLTPMRLELSAPEEACILDNEDTFAANGFRFQFDPSAPIRHRLSLTALPHSGAQDGRKAVQFNKDDVSDLCAILSEGSTYDAGDGGTGTDGTGMYSNNAVRRHAASQDTSDRILARLPKAIAMFASRACRTSIMIGTALSQKEMENIVQRMAEVDQPWNCPHGRPTMRHVGDVQSTLQDDERAAAEFISDPTITLPPMTQDVPMKDEEEEDDEGTKDDGCNDKSNSQASYV